MTTLTDRTWKVVDFVVVYFATVLFVSILFPIVLTVVTVLMHGGRDALFLAMVLTPSVYVAEVVSEKAVILATSLVLSFLTMLRPSTLQLKLLRRVAFAVVTVVGGLSALMVDNVRHGRYATDIMHVLPFLPTLAIALALLGAIIPTEFIGKDRTAPSAHLRNPRA